MSPSARNLLAGFLEALRRGESIAQRALDHLSERHSDVDHDHAHRDPAGGWAPRHPGRRPAAHRARACRPRCAGISTRSTTPARRSPSTAWMAATLMRNPAATAAFGTDRRGRRRLRPPGRRRRAGDLRRARRRPAGRAARARQHAGGPALAQRVGPAPARSGQRVGRDSPGGAGRHRRGAGRAAGPHGEAAAGDDLRRRAAAAHPRHAGARHRGAAPRSAVLGPAARRPRAPASRPRRPACPAAYNAAIEGMPIGPCAGSCGTAAWRGETVVASDIALDPLWIDYRELALRHGLRACWSVCITASDRQGARHLRRVLSQPARADQRGPAPAGHRPPHRRHRDRARALPGGDRAARAPAARGDGLGAGDDLPGRHADCGSSTPTSATPTGSARRATSSSAGPCASWSMPSTYEVMEPHLQQVLAGREVRYERRQRGARRRAARLRGALRAEPRRRRAPCAATSCCSTTSPRASRTRRCCISSPTTTSSPRCPTATCSTSTWRSP